MKGSAEIAEVFGVFHDGVIGDSVPHEDGVIVVEIEYLGRRLSPGGKSFTVRFDGLEEAVFAPWEDHGQPALPAIVGLTAIAALELEILSAKVAGDSVEVACSCRGTGCPGGSLVITASGCRVHDESGHEWSLEGLKKLADEYWDEWRARGREHG